MDPKQKKGTSTESLDDDAGIVLKSRHHDFEIRDSKPKLCNTLSYFLPEI